LRPYIDPGNSNPHRSVRKWLLGKGLRGNQANQYGQNREINSFQQKFLPRQLAHVLNRLHRRMSGDCSVRATALQSGGRVGPRSQVARKAILKAAYHLLKDQEHEGVSTSQLASNAGVSTATLYRWWPTKEAVLLEAFFEAAGEMLPFRQDKSPLARLRKHVVEAARFLKSEHGRAMARLIMAIQEDDELRRGFLQIYYLPRRAAAHAVIQEAIQAGELPSDTDPEILIDALYGPLYARLLLGHAPPDEKFAEKISDLLIKAQQKHSCHQRSI
jgi:AcrR family transcriptional regulator